MQEVNADGGPNINTLFCLIDSIYFSLACTETNTISSCPSDPMSKMQINGALPHNSSAGMEMKNVMYFEVLSLQWFSAVAEL